MAIDLKTPPELDEMPAGDVRDDTLLVAWDETSGRLKRVRRDAIAAGGGEPAGEFVREINTVPPFDDWGLPDKRVVAGIGDRGNLEIAYYGEYDDDDGWFDEVYSFKAGAFYSLVNLKVSAFDASHNATEETSSLEIGYEGGPIRIMASCEEGARQQEVSLSALTIPDLDDPLKEDIIGMTSKLTKASIEQNAVRNIHQVSPFDQMGLSPNLNIVGAFDAGDPMLTIGTISDMGAQFPETGTFLQCLSNEHLAELTVSAMDEGDVLTNLQITAAQDGLNINVESAENVTPWEYDLKFKELTEPDLDDPQYEDFIGMTPKLTKALVNAPTPQITTAVNLTLTAAHNGALVVCTDAVTITASSLPSGFECLVLATNGDVEIAGAFLYEGGNDTISIDGSAAKVMNLDGIGAWVSGCDS